MAIRFVAVDPGAAKPSDPERAPEAPAPEASCPSVDPPEAAEPSELETAAAGPAGDEPAPPHAGSEPKPRRRRKAVTPAHESATAGLPTRAGEVPAHVVASPLLFPELQCPPKPTARRRKNRHGFG